MRRRRILLLEALAVVAVVNALKVGAHLGGLEPLELNSLFTSMIGGAIFLFGLILSGTLADYKESDKVPAELATALESVREEVRATHAKDDAFDPVPVLEVLAEVPARLRAALADGDYRALHDAVSALTPHFADMEAHGALPQYVSRLRADQSTLRRIALRVQHVQRIDFLPSAYVLLVTIVGLVIGILVFTSIEPLLLSVVLVSFVTFLFVYVLRLLRLLERPFRPAGETRDDVSLFLLDELEVRLAEDIAEARGAGARARRTAPNGSPRTAVTSPRSRTSNDGRSSSPHVLSHGRRRE